MEHPIRTIDAEFRNSGMAKHDEHHNDAQEEKGDVHCLGCSIEHELKVHAPFTLLGTLVGAVLLGVFLLIKLPEGTSKILFEIFHPTHVFFSAMTTAAVYYLHNKRCGMFKLLVVGYVGSIGIATLSDCVIPYIGEVLLKMPHAHLHLGFIHLWWLVNPLAIAGVIVARFATVSKFPHFMHVQISTWASLFHITMAMGASLTPVTFFLILVFLFVAVWIPCCTSDIVFPLLFTPGASKRENPEIQE